MKPTTPHHRRPRTQRGAVARGFLVALGLASGLAGAVGLQIRGPQLQDRLARWVGVEPALRVALPCAPGIAAASPAMHAGQASTVAAAHGVGVMPAI